MVVLSGSVACLGMDCLSSGRARSREAGSVRPLLPECDQGRRVILVIAGSRIKGRSKGHPKSRHAVNKPMPCNDRVQPSCAPNKCSPLRLRPFHCAMRPANRRPSRHVDAQGSSGRLSNLPLEHESGPRNFSDFQQSRAWTTRITRVKSGLSEGKLGCCLDYAVSSATRRKRRLLFFACDFCFGQHDT